MAPLDEEIMRRVQAGEVELFDLLFRRYQPALLRVAYSKLGESAWAEDVVQEAFLAAFVSRASYRPQFAFRTWLWTILLNVCRKQWRRHARRAAAPSPTKRPPDADVDDPALQCRESGLTALLTAERRSVVHRLLAELDESHADALRLRFFAELSYEQIAATMGSSVSGAKQRVRVGLERMTKKLREWEGEAT